MTTKALTEYAAARAAVRRRERFEAFESGLAQGLTTDQALSDVDWTASAAIRTYQRYRRPVPYELRVAHRRCRREMGA